jgi:hypothetical protein
MKKVLPFLKYERKNFLELQHLINIEKRMKKSYDKRSLTEKVGIGETYMSEQTRLSHKSVLEESPSLLVLRYQAGYLGRQVRLEGQRVFDELAVKTLRKWQALAQLFLKKMGSIGEFWQGLGKLEKDKFNTELTY